MNDRINIILSCSFMFLCFSNFFIFAILKNSIHKLRCETSHVFATDVTNTLNYNVERLMEYNVYAAFRILNMPKDVDQNTVQMDLVAVGGNFSRKAFIKAKHDYYPNSIHRCVLTTFPSVYFTVHVEHEIIRKKVFYLMSIYLLIGFILTFAFTCHLVYQAKNRK